MWFLILNLFTIMFGFAQNQFKDYSNENPHVNGNQIFRSTKNEYRIKIPKNWKISKGNSLGAEFNAKSPLEDASINMIVVNLKTLPKFSAHDIPINAIMETIRESVPSAKLIESEKQYLSNEKAMYVKYHYNYKTIDINTDIICIQYSIIKETKIFTITLQSQEAVYSKFKEKFKETLLSFIFEKY